MTSAAPAAVLWDMDGTLVNTEPYWIAAETELIESFGGTWSHEEAMTLVGSGLETSAAVMQERGVALSSGEIIDRLTDRVLDQLATRGIPWRPGARTLLRELRSLEIPTALVTMSIGRMARHVASEVGFDAFDAVICGDEVEHSKPHPEPYAKACEILAVAPEDCVAIEDSPPGIASASAAGVCVIGVPFMVDLSTAGAAVVWSSLDGRGVADLSDVLAERSAS